MATWERGMADTRWIEHGTEGARQRGLGWKAGLGVSVVASRARRFLGFAGVPGEPVPTGRGDGRDNTQEDLDEPWRI